jgi:hypothetical protein
VQVQVVKEATMDVSKMDVWSGCPMSWIALVDNETR